jgi:hypothetical protein
MMQAYEAIPNPSQGSGGSLRLRLPPGYCY